MEPHSEGLPCQYGTHKATKREKDVEFKRVVATLKNTSTGDIIAILHYFFKDCPKQDIVLALHGNVRGTSKRPYMRREPSTEHQRNLSQQETYKTLW